MVYIHTAFFHLPLRERKKPPRLPLSETEAVHYALFVLSQALTQLLAGVLDCSLSGCQNYRAFGFTIFRYLKSFQLTFTTFCLFSPSWGIKDTSNIFIGSIQYQSYLRLNDHLIQIMQPCWYLAIIFYPQNVDSNTVKMVFNLKSIF